MGTRRDPMGERLAGKDPSMAKPRVTRAVSRRARRAAHSSSGAFASGWLTSTRVTVAAAVVVVVVGVGIVLALSLSGEDESDLSLEEISNLSGDSETRLRTITPEQLASEARLPVSEVDALLEVSDIHHWMGINESWANNLDEVRHHILHDMEVLEFDPEHRDEMQVLLDAYDSAASRQASDVRSTLSQSDQARDMDKVYLYGRLVELSNQLGQDDWTAHYQEHLDEAVAEEPEEQTQQDIAAP